ncbi:RNA polymerase-associated protein CTR9 [Galdieria sulphuraria]|nr:RNA polymerase-associated protein CTR9 [Galdieria sulphuraria]
MSQEDAQSLGHCTLERVLKKASSLVKEQKLEECKTVLEEALLNSSRNPSELFDQKEVVALRERLTGCYLMLIATGRQNARTKEDTQKQISEQIAFLHSQFGSTIRLQELQGWKEILGERYESALRCFEQISSAPKSLLSSIGSATAKFYKGDIQDSLESFGSIVRRWRRCESAWLGIARCYLEKGDHKKAQMALSKTIEFAKQKSTGFSSFFSYEAQLSIAYIAFGQGTKEGVEAGLSILKELYRDNTNDAQNDPRVVNRLAEYLFYRKEYKRASALLSCAFGSQDGYGLPQARLALANLYLSREDFQAAADCLERVISQRPECLEAKATLGIILTLFEMKNLDTTIGQEEKLTKYFSFEDSLRLFDEQPNIIIARNSPSVKIRLQNNIASLLTRIGRYSEAEKVLSTIFNIYTDLSSGDYDEDVFLQNIQKYNEIPILLLYNQALVWELEGKMVLARTLYSHIISVYGEYPDALFRLGYLSYANDDFVAAKEFYERGAKFKPKLASHLLATLARSQGDYHKYQSLLEQALQSRQFNETREALDDDYSFVRLCNFYIDCLQVVDERRQRKFMDKCLELLQRVLSHYPYNAFAANAFGIYVSLREMYSDAREIFHGLVGTPAAEMAKLNLAHIQVHLARNLLHSSGERQIVRNAAADTALSSAIKLYEDSLLQTRNEETRCEMMLYLSLANFEKAHFSEACRLLTRLLHRMPMYLPLWFNWALTLEECGLRRINEVGEKQKIASVSENASSLNGVHNARKAAAEFGRAYRIFQVLSRRKLSADGEGIVRQTHSSRLADAHHTFAKAKRATSNVLLANAEKEYVEQTERYQERQRILQEKLAQEEKERLEREQRRKEELAALEERELKFQESLKEKEEHKRTAERETVSRKRRRKVLKEQLEETSDFSEKEGTSPTQMQVMEEIFGD